MTLADDPILTHPSTVIADPTGVSGSPGPEHEGSTCPHCGRGDAEATARAAWASWAYLRRPAGAPE